MVSDGRMAIKRRTERETEAAQKFREEDKEVNEKEGKKTKEEKNLRTKIMIWKL